MSEVRIYVVNDDDRTVEIWDKHYAHELIDALVDAGVMVQFGVEAETREMNDG